MLLCALIIDNKHTDFTKNFTEIQLHRRKRTAAHYQNIIMGIRFYCPNGHKLNVKEKLAGKRGVCPHCGVKLLIPQKSTRPSSRDERENQQKLVANSSGNPNEFDVFSDEQGTAEIATSHDEAANVAGAFSEAADDPGVVWYVQLSDGQRFGPATLSIMRSWVRERRIGPNMMVWREGWQDWVEARHVFPEIEQIFRDWKAKKKPADRERPVTLIDTDDEDEPADNRSVILIVSIVSVLLLFGVILFFLLKS